MTEEIVPTNERLTRAAAKLWQSPRLSFWFLVCFAVWLGIGSWVSFPRDRDPWSVYEVKISLMSRVDQDLTVRGNILRSSFDRLRDKGYLIGPCHLEYRRGAKPEPTFLVLTLAIDLPEGETLVVRDKASEDELVLTECPGLFTHIGFPVRGSRAEFELIPSGRQVAYRVPKHLGVRLLRPADRPFRITAISEYSLPIDVKGGKLKLGSGFEFDAGEEKLRVPTGPLEMRRQAWIELEPSQPGPCRIRIPIRKLRETDPGPVFHVSGTRLSPRFTPGFAELTLRIDAKARLRLSRPEVSGHVLDVAYVVGVPDIEIAIAR
jgi:hypothetical protein